MPIFSARSRANLSTCHPDIQRVLEAAIKRVDFAVICGHRSMAEQNRCYQEKASEHQWPNSRHNSLPSQAVDCAPVPIDWDDIQGFRDMAKVILEVAKEVGVELQWGGDWFTFKDFVHFQLKAK